MGILVKLIGSGIGFTSEAIHAARNRSSNNGDVTASSTPRSIPTEGGEYMVADNDTADALIRDGYTELPVYPDGHAELQAYPDAPAELPAYSDDNENNKAAEAEYDSNVDSKPNYSGDADRGVNQDEAVWELDETAQSVRLPTYQESEPLATAASQNEEAKEEQQENMVRGLVQMAGPVQTVQRIPSPVIIPQRRPSNKDRGFVRAYAPVLADCGVSQDVFLKFLEDFFQASKASKWIEVVYVAAGIVGFFPETAAQITSIIVQTVAGTAREIQSRRRSNTFLDRVNQDLFMPRGLYAMVMAYKDEAPGQQQGALGLLSQKLGKTLFGFEKVDINQLVAKSTFDPAPTIAKYTHTDHHPEMNMAQKRLKNMRLASGRTYGHIELPDSAPLVYPDLDRAAARAMEGKGDEGEGTRERMKSAGSWVQDYFDRKAQASYEARNPGSSLAVPESGRKGFDSRYNDPNHAVNNGKLTSVLTGGLLGSNPGLIERATNSIKESQEVKRLARGEPLSEPFKEKWQRYQCKRKPGLAKKVLQQDVLYLLIVNMPTEEELQQSIAQIEHLMQQTVQSVPH
ncbi:hypothetical protein BDV32DRAFT_147709 [Aspergillus pseudonomiae]|uniref:Uncharacterized protein n=1 Tax=Aspergillus pseudonomiae TaxID=1506151 RepID=A0A5N6I8J0_9EURO|nr:uncharacterized protein BDV37DRAFT_284444 [Aspergillus pseudonomiae]KAB8262060.1 hypothetical protein BDV32DRAFT_147709 [Aspergillus pseudonomiae]KAE8402637.1 hypothetical protein BDV37DRAFT_284444 [Aspergillus pseudonomiae]